MVINQPTEENMEKMVKDILFQRDTRPLAERLEDAAVLATPERVRENLCMEASVAIKELQDALDDLLTATVDDDLNHGIGLTEAEELAREKALAIIAKIGERE